MKKINKYSSSISIITLLILFVACKSRDKETIQIEQLNIPFKLTTGTSKTYYLNSIDYYKNSNWSAQYYGYINNNSLTRRPDNTKDRNFYRDKPIYIRDMM